jgi:hypothetical protein
VAACLTGPAPAVERSHARDEVRFQLLHNTWFSLHVAARDGLPVSGWVNGALESRGESLTLANAWPSTPLVSITGSHCREIAGLLAAEGEFLPWLKPALEFGARVWRLDALPADWDAGTTEFSLAVMDVDESAITPVPLVALLMKSSDTGATPAAHPLAGLVPSDQTIPLEWDGQPGVLLPWLTEKLTLCLAQDNGYWVAATQEPLMASLVGKLKPETAVTADMVVRMDWAGFARKTQSLLMKAAENELVPFMNKEDVADKFNPLFDVAAQFGALRIEAAAADARVEFRGFLAGSR